MASNLRLSRGRPVLSFRSGKGGGVSVAVVAVEASGMKRRQSRNDSEMIQFVGERRETEDPHAPVLIIGFPVPPFDAQGRRTLSNFCICGHVCASEQWKLE